MIHARIKGMSELSKQLHSYGNRVVPEKFGAWLGVWGKRMSDDMKRTLQRGGKGRYSGKLAGSMSWRVERDGSKVWMKVGSNAIGSAPVPYAAYVEGWPKPPRRHFLPFRGHDDFADWARRVAKLKLSQIDTSAPGRRRQKRTGPMRSRNVRTQSIDWRDRKKIKGLMVGGPKSTRPAILPAVRRNIPLMARDARRILD